ncbi:MAG: hypothetical protein HW398_1150 [Acidobacteria bacterium]|nr:hypothetical protein [Acidobacteriota bacterium]
MKAKFNSAQRVARVRSFRRVVWELSQPLALMKAFLVVTVWVAEPLILNSAPAGEWTDQEIRQLFTPAGLTPDQVGRFIVETDPDTYISLKWNRFAIFDPQTALEARERQKTPEHKARERLAIQAITQAPEFLRLKQEEEARKDPKQKAQDDAARLRARLAIEKPFEAAKDAEKTKDAATKRREQIAVEAILNPREFNERVDRQMSAELKAREAEAIRAFSQPKEFLEERLRLKQLGGPVTVGNKEAPKIKDRPGDPNKPKPNIKEKGQVNAAGGGR